MTVLAVTTRYRELCWNLSTSWTVSILEVRFWRDIGGLEKWDTRIWDLCISLETQKLHNYSRCGFINGSNVNYNALFSITTEELNNNNCPGNIKVLMATNRPDTLDPALTRPGRLDRRVEFGLPDLEGRAHIFKIHARSMSCERDIRWELTRQIKIPSRREILSIQDNRGYVSIDLRKWFKMCTMLIPRQKSGTRGSFSSLCYQSVSVSSMQSKENKH